jgi:hypothetical protein
VIPLVLHGALVLLATALLAAWAYQRGRRGAATAFPADVLAELAEHKLRCLGEPAERVQLELALLFGAARVPTGRETTAPRG